MNIFNVRRLCTGRRDDRIVKKVPSVVLTCFSPHANECNPFCLSRLRSSGRFSALDGGQQNNFFKQTNGRRFFIQSVLFFFFIYLFPAVALHGSKQTHLSPSIPIIYYVPSSTSPLFENSPSNIQICFILIPARLIYQYLPSNK